MAEAARQLSYEAYLALAATGEGLFEYHDGVAVAMTAPSPEHARIAARITERVRAELGQRPCLVLAAGLKVRVEATNRTLLPDVTVVCGPLERSTVDADAIVNPRVVFEVLSPTTADYDQGPKFHQYRRIPSLHEYVVVSQERRFVSISRRSGDLWSFDERGPGDRLRLDALQIELPLDELYHDSLGAITG